jgi:hypothetical protein
MRLGTGEDRGQQHTRAIGDQLVLAARFAFVARVRAGLGPPFNARSDELSVNNQDIVHGRMLKTSCTV